MSVSVAPTTAAENVVTPLDAIDIASVSEVCPMLVPLIIILSTVKLDNASLPTEVGSTFAAVIASSAISPVAIVPSVIFALVTALAASAFVPT